MLRKLDGVTPSFAYHELYEYRLPETEYYTARLSAGRALSPTAHELLAATSRNVLAGLHNRPRAALPTSGQAPSWLPPGASLSKAAAAHRAHRAASAPYQRQCRPSAARNDKSPTERPLRANLTDFPSRWPTSPTDANVGASTAWADHSQSRNLTAAATAAWPATGSPPPVQRHRPTAGPQLDPHVAYPHPGPAPAPPPKSDSAQHAGRTGAEKAARPVLAVITNTARGYLAGASAGPHAMPPPPAPPRSSSPLAQLLLSAGLQGGRGPEEGAQLPSPTPLTQQADRRHTTPIEPQSHHRHRQHHNHRRQERQQRNEQRPAYHEGVPRLAPWLLTDIYKSTAAGACAAPAATATTAARATPQPQALPLEPVGETRASGGNGNSSSPCWATSTLPSPVGALLAALDWQEAAAGLLTCKPPPWRGYVGNGDAGVGVSNLPRRTMPSPFPPPPSPPKHTAAAGATDCRALQQAPFLAGLSTAVAELFPDTFPHPSSCTAPFGTEGQQYPCRDRDRNRAPQLSPSSPEPLHQPGLAADRSPQLHPAADWVGASGGSGGATAAFATWGHLGRAVGAAAVALSPRLPSSSSPEGGFLPPAADEAAGGAGAAASSRMPAGTPPIPAEWLEDVEELLMLLSPRPAGAGDLSAGPGLEPAHAGAGGAASGRRSPCSYPYSPPPRPRPPAYSFPAAKESLAAAQDGRNQPQQQQPRQQPRNASQQRSQQPPLRGTAQNLNVHHAQGQGKGPRRSPPTVSRLARQQQPQSRNGEALLTGRAKLVGSRAQRTQESRNPRATSVGRAQQLLLRRRSGSPLLSAAESTTAAAATSPWTPPGVSPPSQPNRSQSRRDAHLRCQEQQLLLLQRRPLSPPPPYPHQQQQPPHATDAGGADGGVQHSQFDAFASAIARQLLLEAEQMGLAAPLADSCGGGAGVPAELGEVGLLATGELHSEPWALNPEETLLRGVGGAAGGADGPAGHGHGRTTDLGDAAAVGRAVALDLGFDICEPSPRLEAFEEFLGNCRGEGRGNGGGGGGCWWLSQTPLGGHDTVQARSGAGQQVPSYGDGSSSFGVDLRWFDQHDAESAGPVAGTVAGTAQQPRAAWTGSARGREQQRQTRPLWRYAPPSASAPPPPLLDPALAHRVLAGWRRQVQLRRLLHRAAQRCGQRWSSRVLRLWRDHTRTQRAQRQAAWLTLRGIRLLRLLRATWIAWCRAHAAGLHAARLAAARYGRSLAARAMRGWVTRWAQRASVRVLVRHRAGATARACLAVWLQVTAAARLERLEQEAANAATATAAAASAAAARAEEKQQTSRVWCEAAGAAQSGVGQPAWFERRRQAGSCQRQPQPYLKEEEMAGVGEAAEGPDHEEMQSLEYGCRVHQALRLRNCFRSWLLLTDAAVQVMARQQSLRHEMQQELLHDAALRTAADEIARHRYLAPTLHAWRALAAAAAAGGAAASAAAASQTPPGSRVASAAPDDMAPRRAPTALHQQHQQQQLQSLPPMAHAAKPKVRSPAAAGPQHQATVAASTGGVVPWVMKGAATAREEAAGSGSPGPNPHPHPLACDSRAASIAGAVAGLEQQQQQDAAAADSSRDSSCGSGRSFDFNWPPRQPQRPLDPPHHHLYYQQQQQQPHSHGEMPGRGPVRPLSEMTPLGGRLRAPGLPDARPGPVPAAPAGGTAAAAVTARHGSGAHSVNPPDRVPLPSPSNAAIPDLWPNAAPPSVGNEARRSTAAASAAAVSGGGRGSGATSSATTPETAPRPRDAGPGPGPVIPIQRPSAGDAAAGCGGGAAACLNTPPSVHATRLVQSQSRSRGLDAQGGGGGGGSGGAAVLAELAPDVLLQLLESDLAWYTEQYLTPPPAAGAATGGGRPSAGNGRVTATTTAGGTPGSHVATPAAVQVQVPAMTASVTTAVASEWTVRDPVASLPVAQAAVAAAGPADGGGTSTGAWRVAQPLPVTHGMPLPEGLDAVWAPQEPAAGAPVVEGGRRGCAVRCGTGPGERLPGADVDNQSFALAAQHLVGPDGRVRPRSQGSRTAIGGAHWQPSQPPLQQLRRQGSAPSSGAARPGFLTRGDSRMGRPSVWPRRRSSSGGSASPTMSGGGGGALLLDLGEPWPSMGEYAASPTASDEEMPYKHYVALPGDRLLRLRAGRRG